MNKKRIIIKVGTALTTMKDGRLNLPFLSTLVEELSHIHGQQYEIVLVSSGAVAAGRRSLFNTVHQVTNRQALSCLGQPLLMDYYRDFFRVHDKYIGQCLFTTRDFDDERSLEIMKGVLNELLDAGVIPVVNENDACSDIEMKYGDNDQLASRLAVLLKADIMIMLSDVEGLYEENPQTNANATIISEVKEITPDIQSLGGEKVSAHSMGGMKSKLTALKRATEAGVESYIIHGRTTGLLSNILLEGKKEGTFFHAQK